jgi:hypothetical protein
MRRHDTEVDRQYIPATEPSAVETLIALSNASDAIERNGILPTVDLEAHNPTVVDSNKLAAEK